MYVFRVLFSGHYTPCKTGREAFTSPFFVRKRGNSNGFRSVEQSKCFRAKLLLPDFVTENSEELN